MTGGNNRIDELQRRRTRPYPEYRNSGVEWLGKIPEHWEVQRLKYLATLNDEALPGSTDPSLEISYVDISSVDAVAGIIRTEVIVTLGRLIHHIEQGWSPVAEDRSAAEEEWGGHQA